MSLPAASRASHFAPRSFLRALLLSWFATLAPALAVAGTQVTVIDFEEFAEGTSISTQYATLGVTFSIEGAPTLPIVAQEGSPTTAFTGTAADTPASSGLRCLTDPLVAGDFAVPADLRIEFDPPVSSASFYLIDIDGSESVLASAFDGATVVASQSVVGGAAGTGNGVSTLVTLTAPSIRSIVVDISGPLANTGWAVDFLTFTRPCPTPACTLRMRVSQESAPGIGDFAANPLGEVSVWGAAATSAAAFYAYDVPEGASWNGAALVLSPDRSHLFAAETADGVALFVVHDRAIPDNPDGGVAETKVELIDDLDGGFFAVQDDPPAIEVGQYFAGTPGGSIFAARQVWETCCTDGYTIAGLDAEAVAVVQFTNVDSNPSTPVFSGLLEWVVVGAGGETIPLALVADRRVLLEFLPPSNCPADLNGDGAVDGADLGTLLGNWGFVNPGAGSGTGDLDGSGLVDGGDLGLMLGAWGRCPP